MRMIKTALAAALAAIAALPALAWEFEREGDTAKLLHAGLASFTIDGNSVDTQAPAVFSLECQLIEQDGALFGGVNYFIVLPEVLNGVVDPADTSFAAGDGFMRIGKDGAEPGGDGLVQVQKLLVDQDTMILGSCIMEEAQQNDAMLMVQMELFNKALPEDVSAIRTARSEVNFQFFLGERVMDVSVSARGSTAASSAFWEACGQSDYFVALN